MSLPPSPTEGTSTSVPSRRRMLTRSSSRLQLHPSPLSRRPNNTTTSPFSDFLGVSESVFQLRRQTLRRGRGRRGRERRTHQLTASAVFRGQYLQKALEQGKRRRRRRKRRRSHPMMKREGEEEEEEAGECGKDYRRSRR